MNAKGSCQCGSVTYEVTGEPRMTVKCHCLECQKSTGGGHLMALAFGEDQVTAKGETKGYSYTADSGNEVTTQFCTDCGSSVFGRCSGYPGMVTIRLGSFDDQFSVAPPLQVYTKRRRPWDKEWPDAPEFETMPPMQGE